MASLALSPDRVKVGDSVIVTGADFLPNTKVTVGVPSKGWESDIVSDVDGGFASTDEADRAVATLTSDATNVTANDTVTIGAVTYTFKAAPTTVANEVKIGADAAATLANLKKAINLTGVSGTDYGSGTVVHPTVEATTLTATTLLLVAKAGGTAGNSLASTEASTHLSFGGATFAGGAAASGASTFRYVPGAPGRYAITATDGTNSATATLEVWSNA